MNCEREKHWQCNLIVHETFTQGAEAVVYIDYAEVYRLFYLG